MADYEGENGLRTFSEDFGRFFLSLNEYLAKATTIAGIEFQKTARSLVSVDSGNLRRSIQSTLSNISNGVRATVSPTEPYGYNLEFGQPPGTYVSPAQLMTWAKHRGLNPYAVSKSIMKKGTMPHPYMFPAFEQRQRGMLLIISQGIENAMQEGFK